MGNAIFCISQQEYQNFRYPKLFNPSTFQPFNFSTLQLIFMKKIIKTDKAPDPVGPYNQAIIHNDTLYASGQIALDPATGVLITDTIEAETTQVMANISAILEEAGLSFKDVVKASVFVTDINNFSRINAIYSTYFDEATAPARELVQVSALPRGGNIEISVIAAFD